MLTKQSSNGNILGKFALQIKNITVYGSLSNIPFTTVNNSKKLVYLFDF